MAEPNAHNLGSPHSLPIFFVGWRLPTFYHSAAPLVLSDYILFCFLHLMHTYIQVITFLFLFIVILLKHCRYLIFKKNMLILFSELNIPFNNNNNMAAIPFSFFSLYLCMHLMSLLFFLILC